MAAVSRTRLGEPCLKTYPLECVDLLKRARVAFQAGRTLKEGFRLAQLEAVVRMLEEHECDFVDALGRDLHKVTTMFVLDYDNMSQHNGSSSHFWLHSLFCHQPRFETVVSELVLVKNEALHAINNLKKWMQPQHVERNLVRLLCFHKHLHNIIGIITYTTFFWREHSVWLPQRNVLCRACQSRLKLKLPCPFCKNEVGLFLFLSVCHPVH